MPSKGEALFGASRMESATSGSSIPGLHSEMQLIIESPVTGVKRTILNTYKREDIMQNLLIVACQALCL